MDFKSRRLDFMDFLLPHLDQELTEVDGQQTQHDAESRVENEVKEFLIPQQHEILVHERGKGREPTAQSHGEEQAQVPVKHVTPLEQPVEETDQETTRDVDEERSCGKGHDGKTLYEAGEEKTKYPPEETSQSDKK